MDSGFFAIPTRPFVLSQKTFEIEAAGCARICRYHCCRSSAQYSVSGEPRRSGEEWCTCSKTIYISSCSGHNCTPEGFQLWLQSLIDLVLPARATSSNLPYPSSCTVEDVREVQRILGGGDISINVRQDFCDNFFCSEDRIWHIMHRKA